eukprot:CCRYP_003676-RA/>CCRYP_003676-RA protein AED:0.16 eAED:0.16 QI:336/0.8/0.83/1/0.8/0.66/6/0/484
MIPTMSHDETTLTQDQEEIDALRQMKQELTRVPHCQQSALVHAQRISPNLVDDRSLLMFLEAESFDASRASRRLVSYWEARFQLFGPVNCFLPMTLDGAMRDSWDALRAGYLTLLPCTDNLGRPIVYTVSIKLTREYFGLGQVRVWWYLLHLLMENSDIRKRGFVILSNAKEASMDNFDTCSVKRICSSGEYILPISWKMCHICHSNPIIPTVSRIVRTFLTASQRAKLMLHNGSPEAVLDSLAKNHLTSECLPTELGGTLTVPSESVVRKIMLLEGDKMFMEYHQTNLSIDEAISDKVTLIEESSKWASEVQPQRSDLASCFSDHSDERKPESLLQPGSETYSFSVPGPWGNTRNDEFSESKCGSPNVSDISTSSIQSDKNFSNDNTESFGKKSSKSSKANRPGRLGDPRMNRAVQAKLDNPDISLVTALVRGGFVFPGLEESKGQLSLVKDIDNVTAKESAIAKVAVRKAEDGKEMMLAYLC